MAIINGTANRDIIDASWPGRANPAEDDTINGLAGDDDLYGLGGNDALNGGDGNDFLRGGTGNDILDGGNGTQDIADFGDKTTSVVVTLNGASDSTATVDGIAEDTLRNIEYVFGGSAVDTLTGDANGNFIRGRGGNDILDGGAGFDWADYAGAASAVTVSLATGTSSGGAGVDSLSNFEAIRGSDFDDTLIGNAGNNYLRGGLGADTLDGGAGFDTADYRRAASAVTVNLATGTSSGGDGVDSLSNFEAIRGSDFNDTLIGNAGNNSLTGGLGNDALDGGLGFDRAIYSDATGGITVNMVAGTVTGSGIGTDTLSGIEGAVGSDFADTFNAAGFAGSAGLPGVAAGQNTFEGRGGDDLIIGDLNPLGQAVTRVEYLSATGAVTVDVAAGTGQGTAAGDIANVGHDTFSNVSTIWGSAFNDTIYGSDSAPFTYETYEGRAGDDYIDGRGGYDSVQYNNDSATTSGITVNLAAGTVTGDATVGTDTIRNVEAARGTAFDDVFDATGYGLAGALNFSTTNGSFNDFGGAGGNDTIIGNGSTRLNYQNVAASVTVDLETTAGTAITVAGSATGATEGTDTFTGVNAAQGSMFGDTLRGSSFNNTFHGLGGDDFIDGRGGFDTASYSSLSTVTSGVSVNMTAGTATGDASIGTDTLRSIEGVQGTMLADSYDATGYGSGANIGNFGTFNQFEGLGGNDTITGGSNTRVVYFNATAGVTITLGALGVGSASGDASVGNDTFSGGVNAVAGSNFADSYDGSGFSTGYNGFEGRGGNDTITGNGATQIQYNNATSGVSVNLSTGIATGDVSVGNDTITGGVNSVLGSNFNDTLTGDGLANVLVGNSGNDTLSGASGNDTLTGGNDNDKFIFAPTELTSGDTVGGDQGADIVEFNAAGTVAAAAFTNVTGVETVTLANGTNNISLGNAMVGSATGQTVVVNGGTGNDTVNASAVTTAANRVSINAGAGTDALTGGSGNDFFNFVAADFDSSDTVVGGAGSDTLRLLSAGTVAAARFAGVSGIESITLANGINNITLLNTMIAAATGQLVTVTGGTGNDTVNAAGVISSSNRISINAGAGADTLTGGAGNDTFSFNAAELTNADTLTGGAGIDTLRLLTAGTVAAAAFSNVTAVEIITLANGTNNITLLNGMVGSATGQTVTVTGGTGADTINGAGVTTVPNRLVINSGAGNDTVTAGAGADFLDFAAANLTSLDTVVGGAGSDTLRFLTAGTVAAAAFTNVSGVEVVTLANGANDITLSDAMVGAATGQAITVHGGTGNDTINAGGVTSGSNRVAINSFAGNDTLTGGSNNDVFSFTAASLTGADTVQGGGGTDTLRFATAGTVAAAAFASVIGIELVTLVNGTNNISLADAMVGGATNQLLSVNGGSGNDTIDASAVTTAANRVSVNAGAGDDTLTGGAGNDTLSFTTSALTSADTVAGGAGTDTLRFLNAGTVAAGAFGNVTEVEVLTLANGTNNITLADAMVGSANNDVMTVTGGTGNDTVNAAALSTGTNRVSINAGAGNDNLTGGASNDTFNGGDGSDTMTGNGGNDVFVYGAASHSNETAGLDLIIDFSATDRLNFSALSLTTSEAAILDLGTAAFAGSTADFFNDGGVDRAVAVQTDGTNTRVYADTNGDGNYTVGTDLAIQFTGDVRAFLNTTGDYLL